MSFYDRCVENFMAFIKGLGLVTFVAFLLIIVYHVWPSSGPAVKAQESSSSKDPPVAPSVPTPPKAPPATQPPPAPPTPQTPPEQPVQKPHQALQNLPAENPLGVAAVEKQEQLQKRFDSIKENLTRFKTDYQAKLDARKTTLEVIDDLKELIKQGRVDCDLYKRECDDALRELAHSESSLRALARDTSHRATSFHDEALKDALKQMERKYLFMARDVPRRKELCVQFLDQLDTIQGFLREADDFLSLQRTFVLTSNSGKKTAGTEIDGKPMKRLRDSLDEFLNLADQYVTNVDVVTEPPPPVKVKAKPAPIVEGEVAEEKAPPLEEATYPKPMEKEKPPVPPVPPAEKMLPVAKVSEAPKTVEAPKAPAVEPVTIPAPASTGQTDSHYISHVVPQQPPSTTESYTLRYVQCPRCGKITQQWVKN